MFIIDLLKKIHVRGVIRILFKYEVFHEVVEAGSLTKAAEVLKVTQSAISHAISSLENEFGFSLLTRNRSGIYLTSNGEHILKHVREILQQEEKLRQEVAAIHSLEIGTVRIGTFTSVSTQWMPGILRKFQADHPDIEIKLFEGDYDKIDQWLASGAVDFGFMSLPTARSFEVIPLKLDGLLCILPGNHELCQAKVISFEQIKTESFIMPKWGEHSDISKIFVENHIVPRIKYEVLEDQAIVAMVQNGLGISILPEMVLQHNLQQVCTIPLEKTYYRTIGIAAASLTGMSPAAQTFIACVKSWLAGQQLLDF
jgi:DNA-binding transcriptional LysR family regulator